MNPQWWVMLLIAGTSLVIGIATHILNLTVVAKSTENNDPSDILTVIAFGLFFLAFAAFVLTVELASAWPVFQQ